MKSEYLSAAAPIAGKTTSDRAPDGTPQFTSRSERKKHSGIIVPMVTPVSNSGALDENAVRRVIDFILAGGVSGIFVLGTTGEAASVCRTARLRLVDLTVEHVNGRSLVYAGIGDNSTADAIDAGNRYLKAGVDAVVALLPCYYSINGREMLQYFRQLLDGVEGPLVIYNIPQTTHLSIPIQVLDELVGHPRLIGVKDSEDDAQRLAEIVRRFGNGNDFSVFVGVGVHMASTLLVGADGAVPGFGNLVPRLCQDLYEACLQRDQAKASAADRLMMEAASFWQGDRTLGQSLAALKAAMSLLGLCEPTVLSPLITADNRERETLRADMLRLGLLK
jgi:4-hydroxy-tetrahydrodipicolinate synthase